MQPRSSITFACTCLNRPWGQQTSLLLISKNYWSFGLLAWKEQLAWATACMHNKAFFVCIEAKRCLFGLWLQDNTLKSLRRRYVTYLAMIVGNKCDKHLRAVRLDVLETTCPIATGKRVLFENHLPGLGTVGSNEAPACQTKHFYRNLKKWSSSGPRFWREWTILDKWMPLGSKPYFETHSLTSKKLLRNVSSRN